MTPALKMSDLRQNPYCLSISGAMYPGVPQMILDSLDPLEISSSLRANPKSASLMSNTPVSFELKRIFSGFKSLWIICFYAM